MGQIVIDIPNKTNRRFSVEKAEEARKILKILDQLFPQDGSPAELSRQQVQDLMDGMRAERVLAQMRKGDEKYTVQQLRDEFGLS